MMSFIIPIITWGTHIGECNQSNLDIHVADTWNKCNRVTYLHTQPVPSYKHTIFIIAYMYTTQNAWKHTYQKIHKLWKHVKPKGKLAVHGTGQGQLCRHLDRGVILHRVRLGALPLLLVRSTVPSRLSAEQQWSVFHFSTGYCSASGSAPPLIRSVRRQTCRSSSLAVLWPSVMEPLAGRGTNRRHRRTSPSSLG